MGPHAGRKVVTTLASRCKRFQPVKLHYSGGDSSRLCTSASDKIRVLIARELVIEGLAMDLAAGDRLAVVGLSAR